MKKTLLSLLPLLIFTLTATVSAKWEFISPSDTAAIGELYTFNNGQNILGFEFSRGGRYSLYRTYDAGKTWLKKDTHGIDPNISSFEFVTMHNGLLWAGTNCSIYKSADSGNTWKVDPLFPSTNAAFSFLIKDSMVLIGTFGGFYRSLDYGKTWGPEILIPDIDGMTLGVIWCLMEFRGVIYAGSTCGIWASKDRGLTWEKRGLNYLNAPGATITSLQRIDTVFLMSTYAALYRSYNLGLNEASWLYTFDSDQTWQLHVVDSSKIYACDEDGTFYYSNDTGKTYSKFIVDIAKQLHCWKIRDDSKYIYLCCDNGIYRQLKNDDPTGVVKEPVGGVKQKKLEQLLVKNNELQGVLSEASAIELGIYRLNGQKVFTYSNNMLPSGKFFIDLKESKLSSGLYVVTTKTGTGFESQAISVK